MRGHRVTLTDVGDKARYSAALFEATEALNKAEVDNVWDG